MCSSFFIKNIMFMISGGVAGLLFFLVIVLIISCLYDFVDFGVVVLFLFIVVFIGNFVLFIYE